MDGDLLGGHVDGRNSCDASFERSKAQRPFFPFRGSDPRDALAIQTETASPTFALRVYILVGVEANQHQRNRPSIPEDLHHPPFLTRVVGVLVLVHLNDKVVRTHIDVNVGTTTRTPSFDGLIEDAFQGGKCLTDEIHHDTLLDAKVLGDLLVGELVAEAPDTVAVVLRVAERAAHGR